MPGVPRSDETEVRLGVVLASHDRRETTVRCLSSIYSQALDHTARMEIFLVDDRSEDGTVDTVRARFPAVHILSGPGDLYWAGSMRLGLLKAAESPTRFTHYLWLNDDVALKVDAVERLLSTSFELYRHTGKPAIVVGTMVDPASGRPVYGGLRHLWPLPFLRLVSAGSHPVECTTMNGNCVLVPEVVMKAVGTIDPVWTHARGDLDYGFRARAMGFRVWVAPGVHGECKPNRLGRWRNIDLSFSDRIASLDDPKYAMLEKRKMVRRHFGVMGSLAVLAPYVYIVLTHPLSKLRNAVRRPR
jgi:GT2 family glycosyltransferase